MQTLAATNMTDTCTRTRDDDGAGDEAALFAIEVPMALDVIGEDNTFRTQNTSPNDWERRNIIERRQGSIHTRVELMEVIHGTYDTDGDRATLLVFRFRFDAHKSTRRVIRAYVHIEFLAADKKRAPPTVDAIAPEGRCKVSPTTDSETFTKSTEMNLGIQGVPFLQAGTAARVEKTTSRDVSDAATITGSINLGSGRNSGESTAAVWNLKENPSRKTGVSDSATVAVLLRREDDAPFNASVTLDTDVDFSSGLERRFTKIPLDDLVLFNPQITGNKRKRGRRYGAENLGSLDLYSFFQVPHD